jgi:hypothetical protein
MRWQVTTLPGCLTQSIGMTTAASRMDALQAGLEGYEQDAQPGQQQQPQVQLNAKDIEQLHLTSEEESWAEKLHSSWGDDAGGLPPRRGSPRRKSRGSAPAMHAARRCSP